MEIVIFMLEQILKNNKKLDKSVQTQLRCSIFILKEELANNDLLQLYRDDFVTEDIWQQVCDSLEINCDASEAAITFTEVTSNGSKNRGK